MLGNFFFKGPLALISALAGFAYVAMADPCGGETVFAPTTPVSRQGIPREF